MSPEQLNQVKNEVQKILDHHLEEDKRFSIQDLDEESVFILIDLLLEKNEKKRKNIRTKINKKIITNQKNIELTYEQVLEIKDKLDYLKNDYQNLNDLKNIINFDSELENQLNNI